MPTAYVLITCDLGSEDYVISQLKSIDSVRNAHGTFGPFDMIAKLEADSEEKLKQTITKRIRKVPKIRATLTLMAEEKGESFGKSLNHNEREILKRYTAQAYILIHCEKTKENEVLHELIPIPEVIEGDVVIGSYEVICQVIAPTYNDISDVVTKKIRKIKNIKTTATLNVIEEQTGYKKNL